MPFTTPEEEALDRLVQYNSNTYDITTNPYGLAGLGYRANPSTGFVGNWQGTTTDLSTVANAIARILDEDGGDAAASAAAAQASADDAAESASLAMTALIGADSTSSVLIGTGTKSFTITVDRQFTVGENRKVFSKANVAQAMYGTVTSWDTGTNVLVMNITSIEQGASGTFNDWTLVASGQQGPIGEMNINGKPAETTIALADEFGFYDTSAGSNKKITYANLLLGLKRETIALTTSRDFALTDFGNYLRFTGATGQTFTIPTNASMAAAVGAEFDFFNATSDEVTIDVETGVTVNGVTDGAVVLSAFGGFSLKKAATDTWDYCGTNAEAWL